MNSNLQPRTDVSPAPTLTVPAGGRFLGNTRDVLRRDQHAVYLAWQKRHGDLLHIKLPFNISWYFLAHPDHVGQMLLGSHSTYAKGAFWNRVRMLMGDGLLTSDGTRWREQRRQLQPAFKATHHAEFFGAMKDNLLAMTERWEPWASQKEFDITEEMMRITLLNAGKTLFGADFTPRIDAMCHDMSVCVQRINSTNFSRKNTFNPKLLMAQKRMHRAIDEILGTRRALLERGESPDDMLGALMNARDAQGQPLSETELHAEIMTFLFTGQETTAIALTWMWYLLAQNPDVEARLLDEFERELGGRTPNLEDLPRLEYTRRVFLEVLRLYPPVWGIPRETTQEVEIGGYVIPARSILVTLPYVTHRHPDFWDEPERFDPDRHLPERVEARHKYAFFPFGGGPRLCIANHFAMMEATLLTALVLPRFKLQMVPGQEVKEALWATLHPEKGLMMTLEARK